jgi:hypothetical protein
MASERALSGPRSDDILADNWATPWRCSCAAGSEPGFPRHNNVETKGQSPGRRTSFTSSCTRRWRPSREVLKLFKAFELDPETETPGRQVVRHIGEALVQAMEMALKAGPPAAAQLVAAECVVEAETKDHLNWELLGQVAEKAKGAAREVLKGR